MPNNKVTEKHTYKWIHGDDSWVHESSGGSGMTVDDFGNWSLQQQESN